VAGVKRGKVTGHMFEQRLIDYVRARETIYIPTYNYVLRTKLHSEIALLKGLIKEGQKIALIDYDVNEDVQNTTKPLSHASLIKAALQ
jgi:hypothetical protein